MAVNSSERKNPPTRRIAKITASGVATVKTAHAARKAELITPTTTSTERKPKRPMMRAATAFIPSAPTD